MQIIKEKFISAMINLLLPQRTCFGLSEKYDLRNFWIHAFFAISPPRGVKYFSNFSNFQSRMLVKDSIFVFIGERIKFATLKKRRFLKNISEIIAIFRFRDFAKRGLVSNRRVFISRQPYASESWNFQGKFLSLI